MTDVRIDPRTLRLVGLPDRVDARTWDSLRWPPCPACGQTVEVEYIEIGTLADDPANRPRIPGPWSCPSNCDPRYPHLVVADDFHQFVDYCRDEGWNSMRVLFVKGTDLSTTYCLRGIVLLPSMISVVGRLSREVQAYITTRIEPGHTWNTF